MSICILILFQSIFRFAFGPQHPASHGVLSIILYMANEYILHLDICIGFLHRGTEKLCEVKNIDQSIPYFDRLDYVSVIFNEYMLCFAFELLIRATITFKTSLIRILFCELTRIFNGLLAISCNILDLGAISPLLWSFEERDKIMVLFDYTCGVRMHIAFICLCGNSDDLPHGAIDYIYIILYSCEFCIEIFEFLVLGNKIFYYRMRGVAFLCF